MARRQTVLVSASARLDGMGLGRFCGVIHDPQRDRRDFYLGLRERLENLAEEKRITDPTRELALRDLCPSVQAAIIEVLVTKTMRATERMAVKCVTASGGVTANRSLRAELAKACATRGFNLRVADRSLCTDNAAMIGILAERKLQHGQPTTDLDADIAPGLALA